MTLKKIAAFEPYEVGDMYDKDAITLAAELNKPIYGPIDLKETYQSKEKLGNVFYIPMSEKEKDYAMLVVIEEELQHFLSLAKEKEVKLISLPFVVTLREMS